MQEIHSIYYTGADFASNAELTIARQAGCADPVDLDSPRLWKRFRQWVARTRSALKRMNEAQREYQSLIDEQ